MEKRNQPNHKNGRKERKTIGECTRESLFRHLVGVPLHALNRKLFGGARQHNRHFTRKNRLFLANAVNAPVKAARSPRTDDASPGSAAQNGPSPEGLSLERIAGCRRDHSERSRRRSQTEIPVGGRFLRHDARQDQRKNQDNCQVSHLFQCTHSCCQTTLTSFHLMNAQEHQVQANWF